LAETSQTGESGRGWLLLVYQLPARPSRLRVKVWRRLQRLGAIPVKNSAYALPHTPQAREDFEWLREEITALRGGAAVFAADPGDERTAAELAGEFRAARSREYAALREEAAAVAARQGRRGGMARPRLQRAARMLRARWDELSAVDSLGSPGRQEAGQAIEKLEALLAPRSQATWQAPSGGTIMATGKFRKRTWVTRPRPGVDRMSSAWLIRRFIDPQARFQFAGAAPQTGSALPFDMYGVEFGHHGGECTFETLARRFRVRDRAVGRIAQIVHNLDLLDDKYDTPEAATLGQLIAGLRQSCPDDHQLLDRGMAMFEALYRSLAHPAPRKRKAQAGTTARAGC
jgi:hypothetical protein